MNQLSEKNKYVTSKEECENYVKGRVCSGCGRALSALETVDNADNPTFWSGCVACNSFDSGVSEYIFKIAEQMVKKEHYVHYSHLGVMENQKPEMLGYWLSSQIRGTTGLVLQVIVNYHKFKSK